jgi:ubiquinone/menaquinone biosynthesis C-methylase UbiE
MGNNRMNWRGSLFRVLFRLSGWIRSLSVFVMKPEDLIAFTRRTYGEPGQVKCWNDPTLVERGLQEQELGLLDALPVRAGRLLLLGVGGGREAIPLARKGFEVTGVDFVPEMVARAQAEALRSNLEMEGLVQDIVRLDLPPASFDVVWFTTGLYSSVPTRARRVALLRKLHSALRPQGCAVCQFIWGSNGSVHSPRGIRMGRLIARLTFGNREFEEGDQLWNEREFSHQFLDEDGLRSEFAAGGFSVLRLDVTAELGMGEAILVKE